MGDAPFIGYEEARGKAFSLFSECYRLPHEDLPNVLRNLHAIIGDLCEGAVQHISRMREESERKDHLVDLKADYARLFSGPYTLLAPPYGSVYLDGERKVMGDSTVEVRGTYRRAGLDISEDFHDAPDHIAAELEFMYFLIFKEVEALKESDVGRAIDFLSQQKAFLTDHLCAWGPQFTERVEEAAATGFYKNLARATRDFLEENLTVLLNLLNGEKHHFAEMGIEETSPKAEGRTGEGRVTQVT
ncbi:MAG: molecular chaperone TorD family protein [Desulfobacteraceae bacterium]|jgi:TorA maturation chaperone TorD